MIGDCCSACAIDAVTCWAASPAPWPGEFGAPAPDDGAVPPDELRSGPDEAVLPVPPEPHAVTEHATMAIPAAVRAIVLRMKVNSLYFSLRVG
ncbi:hypothetical protein GCM10027258_83300 [Amycolatopsis stemonae]